MSIDEMVKQERSNTNNNMDEVYARNMIKMGKGYNKLDKIMGKVDESGVDEEDMLQEARAGPKGGKSQGENRAPAEKGGWGVLVGACFECGQVTAAF